MTAPREAVDAALDAEAEYARTRQPDGRGHAMPPRDQVERLLAAAVPHLPAGRPVWRDDHDPVGDPMTAASPQVAIDAAARALWAHRNRNATTPDSPGPDGIDVTMARTVLEAAVTVVASECERIVSEIPTVIIEIASGGELSPAEWNTIAVRLEALRAEITGRAAGEAVTAERERIRQLAVSVGAAWLRPCDDPSHVGMLHRIQAKRLVAEGGHALPFADLLEPAP